MTSSLNNISSSPFYKFYHNLKHAVTLLQTTLLIIYLPFMSHKEPQKPGAGILEVLLWMKAGTLDDYNVQRDISLYHIIQQVCCDPTPVALAEWALRAEYTLETTQGCLPLFQSGRGRNTQGWGYIVCECKTELKEVRQAMHRNKLNSLNLVSLTDLHQNNATDVISELFYFIKLVAYFADLVSTNIVSLTCQETVQMRL